jgi:hypothetical protein
VDTTEAAAPESSLPVRASFRRGPREFDAGEIALDALVGLPVPRPRRPAKNTGTKLPSRFMLEVNPSEVRVLDERGEAELETWPRGAVDARIQLLDERELRLELRWRDSLRGGLIVAEKSPEARQVANLLVEDTRVRRGAPADAAAALRRLVAEALPERIQTSLHQACSAIAMLMRDGEEPLLVASAMHGWSNGIAVLTDQALLWWAGGRKDPVVLPRDQVRSAAATEHHRGEVELNVQPRTGKDLVLHLIEPPDRGAELALALNPRADALDDFLAQERDGSVFLSLRDRLEPVRPLLADGERIVTYAGAMRNTTTGALLVTDRRLLWVAGKGSPFEIDRAEIDGAEATRGLIFTRVDLELRGGRRERFEAIDPRDRADDIVAALGFAPP